jgi:uncharacterized protein (TIGR02246 family)
MSVATSTKLNVEAGIQTLFSNFAAAWDKHDAKAMASLFAEDSDLINPAGRMANGKHEIEKLFQDEHSSRFKSSKMNMTISRVRNLTPDIAIVTDNCEVSGVNDPSANGPRTFQSVATFVLQNERGTWRIVSARPMIPFVPTR